MRDAHNTTHTHTPVGQQLGFLPPNHLLALVVQLEHGAEKQRELVVDAPELIDIDLVIAVHVKLRQALQLRAGVFKQRVLHVQRLPQLQKLV